MPRIKDDEVTLPTTPYLLITVGTTKFDELIAVLDERVDDLLALLHTTPQFRAISTILLQTGNAVYTPKHLDDAVAKYNAAHPDAPTAVTTIQWFSFAQGFSHLLQNATFVISHAGAGSILEALRSPKPINARPKLFVVVNELLMDNHQLELAEAFAVNSYLFFSNCAQLFATLPTINWNRLQPYPIPEEALFVNLVAQTLFCNGITQEPPPPPGVLDGDNMNLHIDNNKAKRL